MLRTIVIYLLVGTPIWLIAASLLELYFPQGVFWVLALIVAYVLTGEIYERFFSRFIKVYCPACKAENLAPRKRDQDTHYACRSCGRPWEWD